VVIESGVERRGEPHVSLQLPCLVQENLIN
jgi:hypothetical protein